MLAALFDDGMTTDVKLSDLQNHFYTHLPAIRSAIFDALVGDGYYLHRPDTVRNAYVGAGFFIGFFLAAGSGALAQSTGIVPLTWVLTGMATGGGHQRIRVVHAGAHARGRADAGPGAGV